MGKPAANSPRVIYAARTPRTFQVFVAWVDPAYGGAHNNAADERAQRLRHHREQPAALLDLYHRRLQ